MNIDNKANTSSCVKAEKKGFIYGQFFYLK